MTSVTESCRAAVSPPAQPPQPPTVRVAGTDATGAPFRQTLPLADARRRIERELARADGVVTRDTAGRILEALAAPVKWSAVAAAGVPQECAGVLEVGPIPEGTFGAGDGGRIPLSELRGKARGVEVVASTGAPRHWAEIVSGVPAGRLVIHGIDPAAEAVRRGKPETADCGETCEPCADLERDDRPDLDARLAQLWSAVRRLERRLEIARHEMRTGDRSVVDDLDADRRALAAAEQRLGMLERAVNRARDDRRSIVEQLESRLDGGILARLDGLERIAARLDGRLLQLEQRLGATQRVGEGVGEELLARLETVEQTIRQDAVAFGTARLESLEKHRREQAERLDRLERPARCAITVNTDAGSLDIHRVDVDVPGGEKRLTRIGYVNLEEMPDHLRAIVRAPAGGARRHPSDAPLATHPAKRAT